MSHGSIERRCLRFGSVNLGGEAFTLGVPGPAALGSIATCDRSKATAFNGLAVGLRTYASERLVQRMPIAKGGGVVAISIAPDSAIHTCDLAFGGKYGEVDRHRISPGNPYVGCLSDEIDHAMVSIPNGLPNLVTGANLIVWDSSGFGSASNVGFPLRLELWRGAAVVRSPLRAVYKAHAALLVSGASDIETLYVCVDGRKRVDVIVAAEATSNTADVSVFNFEEISSPLAGAPGLLGISAGSVAMGLDDAGSTTLPVTPGTPVISSFYGNPMSVISIRLTGRAANTVLANVIVRAWDD